MEQQLLFDRLEADLRRPYRKAEAAIRLLNEKVGKLETGEGSKNDIKNLLAQIERFDAISDE